MKPCLEPGEYVISRHHAGKHYGALLLWLNREPLPPAPEDYEHIDGCACFRCDEEEDSD